ncbi:hypothetical protein [Edwardsiella ictaluri]|uniref:hypothetical protein n=1 Tax=Edwardsiella ictaluri TaxID=67780 RepID=UPI00259D2327|nr:hypothetical protein [Edwardsiella ictaluri]
MRPLHLRPARPADASALLALWLKLTIQAHPDIPPGYWRASLPWVRDAYLPGDKRGWRPIVAESAVLSAYCLAICSVRCLWRSATVDVAWHSV